MTDTNPFFHRGPVKDPAYFFGRQTELGYMADLLRQGQSVAITGPRRMGKTSLLFHLSNLETASRHGFDPNQTAWVYLDGGAFDQLDETWFYGAIDRALEGETDTLTYPQFLERLRARTAANRRLIVMIDEFELVAANPGFGLPMFNHLRSLAAQFPIQFVTASKAPLLQLTFAHPDMVSSPFFNIFAPLHLPLFTETEAQQLLHTLSARHGPAFAPETIDFLLAYLGPHPLFLQVGGYRTFAAPADSSGRLTAETQTLVRKQIANDLAQHLTYYWAELDAGAQYALTTLPLMDRDSRRHFIDQLTKAGLLNRGAYLGQLLETFVRQQKVQGVLQSGLFLMDIQSKTVIVDGQTINLASNRFEMLKLLLENPGQVIPLATIQATLWPNDSPNSSEERARSLVRELRANLGPAGERITNRRNQGYILLVD